MKSDELARLREPMSPDKRDRLRKLIANVKMAYNGSSFEDCVDDVCDAVDAMIAEERDRLSAKLNESNAGWFQVAAHLVETFINGPGNLPNCVLGVVEERDALRTANRELRAEVERLRGELETAKRCCDNAETCFGATASVDAKAREGGG